MILKVTDN